MPDDPLAPAQQPAEETSHPPFASRLGAVRIPRPGVRFTIAVFLFINLLLLAGYLWSRGGQTIHVRVEARGNEFAAYIDGQLRARGEFDAPEAGGLSLELEDTVSHNIPSLPKPRGIDSIRVTDLETGEVLFEDDFASGYGPGWTETSGTFKGSGVLDTEGPGVLTIADQSWRNIAVEAEYQNITSGTIRVRALDGDTGVEYRFQPFRDPGNALLLMDQGQPVDRVGGGSIELNRVESIKSLVAMTLRFYPIALLLLALGFVLVVSLQFITLPSLPAGLAATGHSLPWFALGVLVGGAFAVTLYLNYAVGSHMPHVPDEISYIFQAKLLASGQFTASPPPVPDAFHFTAPFAPLVKVINGAWVSVYPFGHPFLLAIGVKFGVVWLVPPVVGAATVALVFLIGREIHSTRVGLVAALLLATSPFFLMTASNFMSHNTAAFYLLASLLFLVMIDRRPILYGVLAGVFFGLLFNTRPFTAVALMPPFAVFLLSWLLSEGQRRVSAQKIGAFIAGGLLMLVAYLLYNYGTTGGVLESGYSSGGNLGERIGFDGNHSVALGIQNEKTWIAYLLLVLNGWPQYIGFMFVLLPFLLGTRSRWDWFLLVCVVSVMAALILYWSHSVIHGPRYWYEMLPLLILLAARGADIAAERLAAAAGQFRRILFGVDQRPTWAGVFVVYLFVFALVGSGLYGWLLGQQEGWRGVPLMPQNATALEHFWEMDDRLAELIDEADVHNALILVDNCPDDWQCYGSVSWMNSPMLDGDIVFARDLEGQRAEVIQAFPARDVYLAAYWLPSLMPYEPPPLDQEPPAQGAVQ